LSITEAEDHPRLCVANPYLEEPYALIALVRFCGGFGRVTSHFYPEGAEKEICFFVYREIPIDEKNLSNQIHDRGILHSPISEDLGLVRGFVRDRSAGRHFRGDCFCFSVSPEKQKILSVSSVSPW
ncbi:MAG: hypothetical protein V1758_03605, partial [Pseudomonadota bacterium]